VHICSESSFGVWRRRLRLCDTAITLAAASSARAIQRKAQQETAFPRRSEPQTTFVHPALLADLQDWIERVAHEPVDGRPGHPDVCVIELGGTVGDIESMPFIEVSIRLTRTYEASAAYDAPLLQRRGRYLRQCSGNALTIEMANRAATCFVSAI